MKCVASAVAFVLTSLGICAFADSMVMGNWSGKFTSAGWEKYSLSAKVIAESRTDYRMMLEVTAANETWPKIVLTGHGMAQYAVFIGRTDLGKERGGICVLTAEAASGKMTGRLWRTEGPVEFSMEKLEIVSPTLGAKPPEGAVVLFDGTNLDAWDLTPGNVRDGAMIVSANNFVSKQEFGDAQIHIEFQTPLMEDERGQGRGNSGVYVAGRYEIQVLDSFGDDPADNLCGGIYKIAAPKVNACLPPLTWQTYDITFRAPRFNQAGEKTKDAEITVKHNGFLIHDALKLPGITPGGVSDKEAPQGPLFLQNHGDAVRYRNIWVLPM